jgi:aromatic ring-opening dioxygenase LigB subunit
MNISSDGVLQVPTQIITVPHGIQGAKRACVSLTKPKTILEQKAAATGTQKIFDPNIDVKMAQEIIKQQYKEKEVIIKFSSKTNNNSGAKTTSRSWQN